MTGEARFDSRLPLYFAIAAFVIGNGFVFINPPLKAPDEYAHFARAYRLGQLRPLTPQHDAYLDAEIPAGILTLYNRFSSISYTGITAHDIVQSRRILLDPSVVVLANLTGVARYPFIPFIPQALGIDLGRLFTRSALLLMYCAREANLLAYIVVIYFALRLMPDARPRITLGLIAMLPMSIHQAASASADALNIAAAIFVPTIVWRAAYFGEAVNRFDRAALIPSTAALSLMKMAYAPFVLLVFTIPARKFGGSRRYAVFVAALLLCNVLGIALWMSQFHRLPRINPDPAVDPRLQAQMMLRHPIRLASTVLATAHVYGADIATGMVGTFGWDELPLPRIPVAIAFLLLASSFVPIAPPRSWRGAIVALTLAVLEFAAILLAHYTEWRSVGESPIGGFQGRYLIPLLPLLIFFTNSKNPPKHSRIIFVAAVAIAVYSVLFLGQQLYPAFPASRFYYRFSNQ